jgi:DNA polymerase-3 subunit beta
VKVTIKKKMMKEVLSRLQGMAGRKTDIPETRNVLIRAAGDGVTISGTDLQTGYIGRHPAEVEESGAVSVSSSKLFEIVREFPGDNIRMEKKDPYLLIDGENVSFSLLGLDPDNYPEPPFTTKAEEMINITESRLREMIEKTNIIMPKPDDYRAHIVGTNIRLSGDEDVMMFRMESTDSNRLNIVETAVSGGKSIKMPSAKPKEEGVLVPKKALYEMSRFLGGDGEVVRVGFFANFIVFEKGEERFYTRVLEGNFPNVSGLLEKREGETVVVAERSGFLAMMKRVSILASESGFAVLFHAKEGRISAHVSNPEMGESREDMEAEVTGEEMQTYFNPKYIIDALGVMGSEKACFCLAGANSAGIWHDDDDPGFTGLVMPVSG